MKFRRDRRSGLPIEPMWSFYPKYWLETAAKQYRWISMYLRLRMIYLGIKRDPARKQYTDVALTLASDDDTDNLEMFNNTGAQAFVSQQRRLDKLSHGGVEHAPTLQPADAPTPSVAADQVALQPGVPSTTAR